MVFIYDNLKWYNFYNTSVCLLLSKCNLLVIVENYA